MANPFEALSKTPAQAPAKTDLATKLADIERQIQWFTKSGQQAPAALMNQRVQLKTQMQGAK